MDRSQWRFDGSDTHNAVHHDPQMMQQNQWSYETEQQNQSQMIHPHGWGTHLYAYPPGTAQGMEASPQIACGVDVDRSMYPDARSMNGMGQFTGIAQRQAPSPLPEHTPPFMENMQNLSPQANFQPQHPTRENSYIDLNRHSSTKSNNAYASSATSVSGHASDDADEGGSSKEQEERLLLQLKDEQNQSWKRIAEIFKNKCGKDYSVPALQMRYRRLRQRRLLDFNDADQAALVAAYDYWETKRWEIISEKMSEFGATDTWTPKACSAAWLRLKSREEGSQGHIADADVDTYT